MKNWWIGLPFYPQNDCYVILAVSGSAIAKIACTNESDSVFHSSSGEELGSSVTQGGVPVSPVMLFPGMQLLAVPVC